MTSLVDAPIDIEDVACTGCGAKQDEVLFNGREHEYTSTTDAWFPVVRCRACGQVRLNPRPAVAELDRIYPPEYYAYHLSDGGEGAGVGQRIKARRYQRRFKQLATSAAPSGPLRVLDVGCADGRLLTWYRESLGDHPVETFGIDISEAAVAQARAAGHEAVTGRFEADRSLPEGSFDLILASHVIEHVADPMAFARRAAELLKPGGLFVFATPNVDCFEVRRFGRFWGGWHFPRHWTLYDPASASRLADAVGLRLERVSYEVNPVFWVWSCHAWLSERVSRRVADWLFPPVAVFLPGRRSFVLMSVFTIVDLFRRALTGRTASMQVECRRPLD